MRNWWQRRSLRVRLAAWYALGGTVLIAVFSATVYLFVQYKIARPLDHQLRLDLVTVRQNLQIQADGRILWKGHDTSTSEPWPASDPWFELWDGEGKLVRRSWPFVDSRVERLPVSPAAGRETISVFSVSSDVRLRVLSVPLGMSGTSEQWMIRVMRIHEPAMNALSSLLAIIIVASPVVVLLLVFGGYAITHKWLKPLDLMVGEANRIGPADLSRRLSILNPHDELGRLAGVFNQTLTRLEDSYIALDRFVADASHELLTPLTTLRSVGEVGLRSARSPDEYCEIIGSMLEEAQRLQLLVGKLLQLARASGGNQAVGHEPVRLDKVVAECVDELSVLAEEKGQRIALDVVECTTRTDPLLFRQALQNLVENAIKFSPTGGAVCIKVRPEKDFCAVDIVDEGVGIEPEFRDRIMDRFFRADSARGAGGFGLGLALTKAYMRALGGRMEYQAIKPHGSAFRLILPRS